MGIVEKGISGLSAGAKCAGEEKTIEDTNHRY